jgi:uncharacterized protein YcbX
MLTERSAFPSPSTVGLVDEIWRYPVKSMQGELLEQVPITERGLLGDRAFVLFDRESGTVATTKHPRQWGALLSCSACFVVPPQPGEVLPPIVITLPNGTSVRSDDADVNVRLSELFGREVALVTSIDEQPMREADRTPEGASDGAATIRREPFARRAPEGTFFDYGPLLMLSNGTLAAFQREHPAGSFDARRFRPNLLIDVGARSDCVEHRWVGQMLLVGETRMRVIDPCPRCVVTTLAQGDLPRDLGILRAVTAQNPVLSATQSPGSLVSAVAGVYVAALGGGVLRRGDSITLLP